MTRRRKLALPARLLGAGLLLFLGAGACEVLAGVHEARLDACRYCTAAHCSSASSECAASAHCSDLASCLAGCGGEPACRSACIATKSVSPLSQDMWLAGALGTCLAANCESECGLACGALSVVAEPDAAPACAQCIEASSSCAAGRTCARSEPCETYLLCRKNCRTGDCVGACLGIDPSANSFFQFFTAIDSRCGSACEQGSDWSCVGHFDWPETPADVRYLSMSFQDIVSGAPIVDATVSMCEPTQPPEGVGAPSDEGGDAGDSACAIPVSSGQTGPDGGVTLADTTFNASQLGLDGFLELSSPDVYPTLVYWGFPLWMSRGAIAMPIRVFSVQDWIYVWPSLLPNGPTVDPARGVVIAATLDCFGTTAAGVAVSLSSAGGGDAGSALYYRSGGTMVSLAADSLTDTSGLAFFVNVRPGPVDLVATPASLGRPSSRVSVIVRAGTVTEVALAPTPQPDEADAHTD